MKSASLEVSSAADNFKVRCLSVTTLVFDSMEET